MDKVIAFSSFSIMKKPYGDPAVAGLESLTSPVFQIAEQAKGFIARAKVTYNLEHLGNFERDWGVSVAFAVADYYDGGLTSTDETHAGTLSIWEDIESVHNFTYSGLHGIAFNFQQSFDSAGNPLKGYDPAR